MIPLRPKDGDVIMTSSGVEVIAISHDPFLTRCCDLCYLYRSDDCDKMDCFVKDNPDKGVGEGFYFKKYEK